jgi:hypothetical protein
MSTNNLKMAALFFAAISLYANSANSQGSTTVIPGEVKLTVQLRSDLEKAIRGSKFQCPGVVAIYEHGTEVWCVKEPYTQGDVILRYRVKKGTNGKIAVRPMPSPR